LGACVSYLIWLARGVARNLETCLIESTLEVCLGIEAARRSVGPTDAMLGRVVDEFVTVDAGRLCESGGRIEN
jgi:hypothetical protein